MFPEQSYGKEENQINQEIKQLSEKLQDTSTFGVSMAVAAEAQATMIKLLNPVIITPEHRIVIFGVVYAASILECKKVVQCRHTTPGVNRYPKIVEDMLRTGDSPELSKIGRTDMREARTEISNLQMIYAGGREQSVAFLSDINPIVPVIEYTIDGKHTSGVALRPIATPLIIKADEAEMDYTSSSGVRISESRIEKRGANEFIAPKFIVRRVQDNIRATKRGGKEKLGDAVAIFSILSIGIGLGSMFIRRGRLIEISLVFLILGVILFYLRYFSDWGKEYFVPAEIEITGEAPLEVSFIGELA